MLKSSLGPRLTLYASNGGLADVQRPHLLIIAKRKTFALFVSPSFLSIAASGNLSDADHITRCR
jgi:hypothetical protein